MSICVYSRRARKNSVRKTGPQNYGCSDEDSLRNAVLESSYGQVSAKKGLCTMIVMVYVIFGVACRQGVEGERTRGNRLYQIIAINTEILCSSKAEQTRKFGFTWHLRTYSSRLAK